MAGVRKNRATAKGLIIIVFTLLAGFNARCQRIFFNTQNLIYTVDFKSGVCALNNSISYDIFTIRDALYSIAVHNDTVYILTLAGNDMYQLKVGDPSSTKYVISLAPPTPLNGSTINSLVADKDGIIYAIDVTDNGLITYNPYTGERKTLGFLPAQPAGDMIFYKGKAFYAAKTGIYEINLADPAKSTLYMLTPGYEFIGLITFPYSCSSNKVYGTSGIGNRADSTIFVELDLDTKTIVSEVCRLGLYILDGASSTDAGTSNGIFVDSILIKAPCALGDSTGLININASSAASDGTEYTLDNTIVNNTGSFPGVAAGTHFIHIKNAVGCVYDTSVTLKTGLTEASIKIAMTDAFNCYKSTGSLTASGKSSYPPVTYAVDNGPFTNNGYFTNLSGGAHIVDIKDPAGCKVDSSVYIPFQNPPGLISSIDISDRRCTLINGIANIHSGAGIDGASLYTQLNNAAAQHSLYLTGLDSGTYNLSVFNNAGCKTDTVINIAFATDPRPAIFISTANQLCLINNGSASVNINGNETPYKINFNSAGFSAQNSYNKLAPGTYQLEVESKNVCLWDTSLTILPYNKQSDDATADTIEPSCSTPAGGKITVNITGTQAPYSFSFMGASYSSGSVIDGLGAGDYSLPISNSDKCIIDTLNVILPIKQDAACNDVYLPGAFTPNGDDKNDLFRPLTSAFVTIVSFEVYNRFGQKIFAQAGVNIRGWDGTLNGKKQLHGAYAWFCRYKVQSGIIKTIKGVVVLIR